MTSARGLTALKDAAAERLAYGPDEAAAALGIGRTKVFELVSQGELISVKIGRRRLIPVVSVNAYMDRLVAEQTSRPASA
jgi:excisionase family DNA binding protein